MRNKLNDNEKKVKVSITINPDLFEIVDKNYKNKSKYIEKLLYNDLLKNKIIKNDFIL